MKSNRQTNEFFNDSKQQSRINNLEVVLKSGLIQDNKLICSWCELMGASGIETLNLLEKHNLLQEKGFIGVDVEEKHIHDLQHQKPQYQWYNDNIFNLIPKFTDMGVLNLDIYGNVGYNKDYNDLRHTKELIVKGIKEFGEFILFYNKDLDSVYRHNQTPGKALRYHTEMICETFNNYLPNRKFNPLDVLPKDAENKIDDGFVGIIGAYEIYKGKSSGKRMANLRVIFR